MSIAKGMSFLSYVFRYLQWELVGVRGGYQEVETFQAGSYGVADRVRGYYTFAMHQVLWPADYLVLSGALETLYPSNV